MLGVIIAIILNSSLLVAWCKNVAFTSARFIVFYLLCCLSFCETFHNYFYSVEFVEQLIKNAKFK